MSNQPSRSSITRSQSPQTQPISRRPEDYAIVPIEELYRLQTRQSDPYPWQKPNPEHDKAVAYGGMAIRAGIGLFLGCLGITAIVSSCQPKSAPPPVIIREAPVQTPQPIQPKAPNSGCIAFCNAEQ